MDPSDVGRPSSSSTSGSIVSTSVAVERSASDLDFAALFVLAESLLGQAAGAVDDLCREVEALTRGAARLQVFHSPAAGKGTALPPQAYDWRIPVTFGGYTYGILWVFPTPPKDPPHSKLWLIRPPAISPGPAAISCSRWSKRHWCVC